MPTMQEEMSEIKTVQHDHEQRLRSVELSQVEIKVTLKSIQNILKYIAGICAVIAGGILLDFIRNN